MVAVYTASKCAIEGFTKALKAELAAFNIRVLLAHPGQMRTPFIGKSPVAELKEEHVGTPADLTIKFLKSCAGKEPIDPEKAASRIVEAVNGTVMFQALAGKDYFRLPLGQEISNGIKGHIEKLTETLETFHEICESVEFKE